MTVLGGIPRVIDAPRVPAIARIAAVAGAVLWLASCTIAPEPMTDTEHTARVRADLATAFSAQERISKPITLTEAVARALKYNLDNRLKLAEQAVADRQTDVSRLELLPKLVANAGYNLRTGNDASLSRNLVTGEDTTEATTSSESRYADGDLSFSWNILDFGISYIRAKQQSDYAFIVEERRRQVVHNIVKDVRAAYWRAVVAERLLPEVDELLKRARKALADAEELERRRIGPVAEALTYQKGLLEALRQLGELRRQMEQARIELAILMNVHPTTRFSLAAAHAADERPLGLGMSQNEMELTALFNRSELRGEAYQLRINQRESRVALLQMLPGIDLTASFNASANSYLVHQTWLSAAPKLAWNLMNLVSGPKYHALTEQQTALSQIRRLALSMAVISQVNLARLEYETAVRSYDLAARLALVEDRLTEQRRAEGSASRGSPLDVIRADLDRVLANLRKDLAYADVQAAYGRVFASLGADPLPDSLSSHSVDAVAEAVEEQFAAWQRGDLLEPTVLAALQQQQFADTGSFPRDDLELQSLEAR